MLVRGLSQELHLLGQVTRGTAAPVLEHHREAGARTQARNRRRAEGEGNAARDLRRKGRVQAANHAGGVILPIRPLVQSFSWIKTKPAFGWKMPDSML